jgi:hypothetical protein
MPLALRAKAHFEVVVGARGCENQVEKGWRGPQRGARCRPHPDYCSLLHLGDVMQPINVSSRLREFLGESICEVLQEGCEAALHRVVYGAGPAADRIGLFSVAGRRALSPADVSALRESLFDDDTWEWEFITRHRPIPEVLFEFVREGRRAVFVFDRRGGKLGYLRDQEIRALDFDAGSPGIRIFNRLVDASDSATQREG